MEVIHTRNVNGGLHAGVALLQARGVRRCSRNGAVYVAPTPVTTTYQRPWERVLVAPQRDANPFFHVIEAMWMLAGRNDVKTVAYYVARMKQFSDDGRKLHGAYGHRWRDHFFSTATLQIVSEQVLKERTFDTLYDLRPMDQLAVIIQRLAADPEDRRCVIQMWDTAEDLNNPSKDVPCNTHVYVWITPDNKLSITICCRSNDIVWGAYGANAVHFSFLQQYLADGLGLSMGPMYQISNNFHGYDATLEPLFDAHMEDPYLKMEACGIPLFEHPRDRAAFDLDLRAFFDEGVTVGLVTPFMRKVVVPISMAYRAYKKKHRGDALEIVQQLKAVAPDWYIACSLWLERRYSTEDDGVNHELV